MILPLLVFAQQVSPPAPSPWPLALLIVGIVALLWEMYRRAYKGRRTSSTVPNDRHDGGSVYVLSNSGYDHLVKVGYTTRDVATRAEELSADTAVPGDFKVEHETTVANPAAVERAAHDRLAPYKVDKDREFFEIDPDEAQQAIEHVLAPKASIGQRGLGALLCGLGVLVTLALVTYSPGDNKIAQSVSALEEIKHLGSGSTLSSLQNALSLFGAWLARALLPRGLGYFILVPSGLIALGGYALVRGQSLRPLGLPMSLALLGALVAATSIGWTGHALQSAPVGWTGTSPPPPSVVRWAGAGGLELADWLRAELSPNGSLALLVGAAGGCVALFIAWRNGRT